MIEWAKNCGSAINLSTWEFLWKSTLKMAIAANVKENMIKMQYRWYIMPKKLLYINKTYSLKCCKCIEGEGTHFHMWWMCTKSKMYWDMLHKELCKIIGYTYGKKPELYLIGLRLEFSPKEDRTLLCYATALVRLAYAQNWRIPELPTLEEWLIKLHHFIDLDCLTRRLDNQNPLKYRVTQQKLKAYLKDEKKISGLVL